MTPAAIYRDYWERKRLVERSAPEFPLRRWWPSEDLCDIEREYAAAIAGASRLLDVGAGDQRVKRKLERAGFGGTYHTMDAGGEYATTFRSLEDVTDPYEAILCLDVLEHLPLEDGLALVDRLVALLAPGGVLVLQTPNARCVRHPMGWDMTHRHVYNVHDLWAYLTARGLAVRGYRIALGPARRSMLTRLRELTGAFVASRILGCDYADNIALIATTPAR